MITRISPSFSQLAAACFPVAWCTVRGYRKPTGYCLTLFPPQPWAGPAAYTGNGRTCYEALAAAVQLFNDSAHAYPDARPLAAAGSYSPPPQPQEFPQDDEPAHEWPSTIRTEQSTTNAMQRLRSITAKPNAAVAATAASSDEQEAEECPKCYGDGQVQVHWNTDSGHEASGWLTCPDCNGTKVATN